MEASERDVSNSWGKMSFESFDLGVESALMPAPLRGGWGQ